LFNSVKWGDSVLYHGATTNFNYIDNNLEINKIPTSLEYSNKRMEFNYSATSFLDEKRTLFSYMLEGSNNAWSDWSKETKAQYTNLPEDNYVFRVRSKNYLNNLGIETSFSFVILPPWYKTVWAYFLYVIAAILLLVVGISVGTNRIKRQKDQLEKVVKQRTHEVTEQKNEIEGQREELQELYNDVTDSIRYAKRLQDSILPSDSFIKELFPESFVYFQPKDIVSGDFYWAEKIGENHLIAAVDCTGHGVPGAFMSLVGANGLNASVREHQLNETNLILEDLNRFAFSSLNKGDEGESVRDGMDMSLISYNPKTREMTFSGANNPLYVVSNGEFKIIKGDKLAIGSFKPGKEEYTQHSVELKTNDMVYLFSDGYPDQFGGQKCKKLMYKQFRNILLDISTLPLGKQKQELHDRLQKWKSDQEQVDDILVIGFRVN
jgi:serine phosphatase RsbU (regulator of sigma subunit)